MPGTTLATFWLSNTDPGYSGTEPSGGDFARFVSPEPGVQGQNRCEFGTAAASIVVDPYTTRSTTGTGDADKFGWAINPTDALGDPYMGGTTSAKRFIRAGTWTFRNVWGTLGVTSQYNVTVRVYKVSGSTRTLVANGTSANFTPSVAGAASTVSFSVAEIEFAEDETFLVSYTLTKVSATATAETVDMILGTNVAGDINVDIPSPGVRTYRSETLTVEAVGTASVTDGHTTVEGVVRDSNGDPVNGATVKLFDQTTDTKISERTVGADGAYTFTRTDTDAGTYFVVGFSGDTLHGTSDRGLTAT